MNEYYNKIKAFQTEIISYAETIFAVYGNELLLRLEEYNLLSSDNNCLESSTAFGYIIEEFLVSKLENYSAVRRDTKYKIKRTEGSTTVSSYDCYSEFDNIRAMVNIKADKQNNNAVAAINKLYADYTENPQQEKCYLVLKIHYKTDISEKDSQRKIFITTINSYFLEEVDLSQEHSQDHRNWSPDVYNANSGRLQISQAFRNAHIIENENISYNNTKQMLATIFNNNHYRR